jgi:heme-degrading monooxygenase HmoA
MFFREEDFPVFLEIFQASKEKIGSFPGCRHLELLKDTTDPGHLVTYSQWDNEEALENYRKSKLFESTWAKTKILFEKKPYAFSLIKTD